MTREGKPDWDLSVVAGPRGAVLFALDLAYRPDPEAKVFQFSPPREVTLNFPLPVYLRQPAELLRVDANRVEAARFTESASGIQITARCGPVNVWVVSPRAGMAAQLNARRMQILGFEESFGFDPADKPTDLEQLNQLQQTAK